MASTPPRNLERLCNRSEDLEIVLVSRDNFLLMTPLLFEVCSGTLDLRHCAFPIRAFLRTTRFAQATVQGIDLERRVVHLTVAPERTTASWRTITWCWALGAMTNRAMIPGSQFAFTFKTLADAVLLRNHLIECFERADVEIDPDRRTQAAHFRDHWRGPGVEWNSSVN